MEVYNRIIKVLSGYEFELANGSWIGEMRIEVCLISTTDRWSGRHAQIHIA